MKPLASNARLLFLTVCMVLFWVAGDAQAAERELHWDSLDVDARLAANGVLDVTERHAMVFTGDWNGGERVFNVRPRQKLEFISLERIEESTGRAEPLRQSIRPNAVDEYSWAGRQTLRWRSRLPSDAPYANTRLVYVLHYKLSGVLLKEDSQYRLDHDFAFPNRAGAILRFSLNLELDPVWKPIGELQTHYNAGPLAPGTSFVLTIPLRNAGTVSPVAIDSSRSPVVLMVTAAIVMIFALIVLSFFFRERRLGRFAEIHTAMIDTAWIEENIVAYPAEVVGAAWDGRVGAPEVVALIARMTAEGKLESEVDGKHSMTLRLKVDRHKLDGYERALIDGLFFNDAIVTSTKEVQRHYKDRGFNPAAVIRPELDKQVKRVLPPGNAPGTSARDSAVRLRAWIAHFGRSVGPRLYRRHDWRHIRAGDFRRIAANSRLAVQVAHRLGYAGSGTADDPCFMYQLCCCSVYLVRCWNRSVRTAMGRNCWHRGVGAVAVELVDQRHEVAAKRRRHCVPQAPGGRSQFFYERA